MGTQIIHQPDGQFALFSSFTDTLIGFDMSRDEVVKYFVELEVESITRSINDKLDGLEAFRNKKQKHQKHHPYFQFALTFAEALESHMQHKDNCDDSRYNLAVEKKFNELNQ